MFKTLISLFLLFSPLLAVIPHGLVHFKLYGTDRIEVLPGKQGTEDIFKNFAFLFPSDEINDYIVPNGIGTFMNISYANLFLRVSIDHSFLFIVTDLCTNCNKNILLNVSHSLTGDIYNFQTSECWSNSFTTSEFNVPQCEVKLKYQNANITGKLGYDTIYLTAYAKSFSLPNLVYISEQDNQVVDSDLNGIFGLGTPDMDGSYGISLFEEFLQNSVMEMPLFSMCLEPIGDGYLYLSAYGNGSLPFDQDSVVWFEQTSPYMHTINTQSISFMDKALPITGDHNTQFTLNMPYLLLADETFNEYTKVMKDFLCHGGSEFAKLCSKLSSLLMEEGSIDLTLSEAESLKKIPPLILHLKGLSHKNLDLTIQKTFAICPSENRKQFSSSMGTTVIPICSIVRLNKENPKKNVIGNVAHTGSGNLYVFDKRNGLLGISQDVVCYPKPTLKNMVVLRLPMTFSLVGQIFIILGFCTVLVLSLNKCDEYFYQEEENENEEGVSLSFLAHNQTRSEITDTNISRTHFR